MPTPAVWAWASYLYSLNFLCGRGMWQTLLPPLQLLLSHFWVCLQQWRCVPWLLPTSSISILKLLFWSFSLHPGSLFSLRAGQPKSVRDLPPQGQSSTNDWQKVVDKHTLASQFLSGTTQIPVGWNLVVPMATCSSMHSLLAIFLFVSHLYFLTCVCSDHLSKNCQHSSPISGSTLGATKTDTGAHNALFFFLTC